MIKKLLPLGVILVGFQLQAQITLTQATHAPSIGDSYSFVQSNAFPYSPGSGGANQTWDLSGFSGSSMQINYVVPANATEPGNFPDANIVEIQAGLGESYYRKNANEYSLEGQLVPGAARVTFTDRRELLSFPMNYQDTQNETFAGTVTNIGAGQTFNRSGTIEITADGYGDLILPYGTVNNVLRIRAVSNYTDTYLGTQIFTYVDTLCFWFNPGTKTFVASTALTYANNTLAIFSGNYISQSDLITSGVSLTESPELKELLSFAPNPSRGTITLFNNSQNPAQFEIMDFSGALYYSAELQPGKLNFQLDKLKAGVYLLRYLQDGKTSSETLLVK